MKDLITIACSNFLVQHSVTTIEAYVRSLYMIGMRMAMFQSDHLSKQYRRGSWAIQDVTLTLNEGMIGLLGPNGAGKSSLMRILATLMPPTRGEAYVHGVPLSQAEDIRKMIGYLPQQLQVYPQLTGREYLDYVATMKGIKDSKLRKIEVDRWIEEVNLQDKANQRNELISAILAVLLAGGSFVPYGDVWRQYAGNPTSQASGLYGNLFLISIT